jgi:hypothetical protein
MLAHTGGAPPAGVWERLESIIAGDVPASAVAPPIPIGAARAREAAQAQRAWAESPSVARRWRWLAAAAAVVALVFGGLWIAERAGDGGGASDTAALARTAMTAPGARQVALTDESGVTLATAVVTRDGTGYLTSTARLPRAAVGRTYQLWGISRTGTISLGVLGRSPRTVAFKAAVPTESLAITTEIAGGVPVSHNAPDAVGDLA